MYLTEKKKNEKVEGTCRFRLGNGQAVCLIEDTGYEAVKWDAQFPRWGDIAWNF